MFRSEGCPLPEVGTYVYEEDIPYECKMCLGLIFDSDMGSRGYVEIGVEHTEIERVGSRCDSDMYYWNTGLTRGEGTDRIIDISASCDICDNFVSASYKASCTI
jgi:hypothetical protein